MAIMTIGLLTQGGEEVVTVPEFTFGVGYVTPSDWNNNRISVDSVEVDNTCDIFNVVSHMTMNTVYNCYLNGVIDDRHKLGFTMIKRRINNTTGIVEIAFRCKETGCFFSALIDTDETVTRSPHAYLVLNALLSNVDYSTLSITNKAELKGYLKKIKNVYTTKASTIYTDGMAQYNRSILNVVQAGGTSYSEYMYNCTESSVSDRNNAFFVNLHSFWNWYKFMTNEFYFPVQYLKAGDKKIYLSLTVSPVVYDHLIKRGLDYDYWEGMDNSAPPVVSYDYQSGTDITQYLDTVGSEIVLDNGSIIRVRSSYDSSDLRNYYYYEIINSIGETIKLTSAFNKATELTMSSGSSLVNTTPSSVTHLNLFDAYYAGFQANDSAKFVVEGVYLWVTPDEEGGVEYYITENFNQSSSFWNKFPTTAITFGAVVLSYWGLVSSDADGGQTSTATRQNDWKRQNLYMPIMCTNVVGYASNTISALYVINLFSTYTTNNIQAPSQLTHGGIIDIDSGANANILWGISDTDEGDEPNHGEGSIGGGSRGSHGGGGTYDDSGDNVGFSLGNGFSSSTSLVNWYLGAMGSSDVNNAMDSVGDWLAINEPSVMFYGYSAKMNNLVSFKVIYAPFAPSTGSLSNMYIHGQPIRGLLAAMPQAQGYPVSNQYKQEALIMNFKLDPYFDSFLDYAPYTKIKIFLPFAGVYDLNPSDIVGNSISVYCAVDWITGDIVYNIRVNNGNINSILYTFTGNSAIELPLVGQDYGTKVQAGVNTALSAGAMVGAIAGMSTGGAGLAVGALVGATASTLVNATKAIADHGQTVSKGSIGSVAGALSPHKAYLIVTRPKQVVATNYGSVYGYPSMQSASLLNLNGYVKVAECHWEIPSATQEEIDELDSLAKSEGMIL